MAAQPMQQRACTQSMLFTTQAGGCGHSAYGAAAPTRHSEVASPSAPLSSQQKASRSLRSARRELGERGADALCGTRNRLLRVRLTEHEAEDVARRTQACRLSLSGFVRRAILRGTGARFAVGHHGFAAEDAAIVRHLTSLAASIRSVTALALAPGTIDETELRRCLTEVLSALTRLSR